MHGFLNYVWTELSNIKEIRDQTQALLTYHPHSENQQVSKDPNAMFGRIKA